MTWAETLAWIEGRMDDGMEEAWHEFNLAGVLDDFQLEDLHQMGYEVKRVGEWQYRMRRTRPRNSDIAHPPPPRT